MSNPLPTKDEGCSKFLEAMLKSTKRPEINDPWLEKTLFDIHKKITVTEFTPPIDIFKK